jgi:hypothetical protein
MFTAPPFDPDTTEPWQAAAAAAKKWHGIQPHPSHWRIAHTHTLSPKAIALVGKSKNPAIPPYSVVYVMEYLPERAMRKHKGVDDAELHGFMKSSWYVETTTTTQQ